MSGWSVHWYEWGVKVPYYYCVNVNFFYVCKYLFHVFRRFYLGCIYIFHCFIFFLDWSLDNYVMPCFVSCYSFYFKVYFVWYKFANPSFILFPFAWNTLFHPITFSLCVSLDLKWLSCRHCIDGSYSATLPLLIVAFSSFTFKFIDRYIILAILLIVLEWFL